MLDCPIGCGARRKKITVGSEETQRQWRFFRSGTQTLNFCRSLHFARGNKSMVYVQMIYVSNWNVHLCQEKSPIYKLSCGKAPNTLQACHYRHATKAFSGLCILYDISIDFSSCNSFANLGFFSKVSVSVGSIIPCVKLLNFKSCLFHRHTITGLGHFQNMKLIHWVEM